MSTFSQIGDAYLARIAQRKRKPAKAITVATLRSLILAANPVIGSLELSDVRNGALKALADDLLKREYSLATIRMVLTTAKMVVASDINEEGEQRFPRNWNNEFIMDNIPADTKGRKKLITPAQIEAAIRDAKPGMREFILVEAATGVRRGEALALRVEDFDPELGILHVARTLSRYGETSPKTEASKREIDLLPELTAILVAMLAGRTTGRLFNVSINEVRWGFLRAKIKSHSLRHFRYTLLQKQKVHPAILQFWIGHSAKGLSAVYGHVHEDIELRQRIVREVGLGFTVPKIAAPVTEQAREMVTHDGSVAGFGHG